MPSSKISRELVWARCVLWTEGPRTVPDEEYMLSIFSWWMKAQQFQANPFLRNAPHFSIQILIWWESKTPAELHWMRPWWCWFFQDHWRNRLASLLLILFSPSILKMSMEWFCCAFRNEIHRHGFFSHSNFIYKDENSRKVISKESDIYSAFTEKPKEFSHSPIPTEPCIFPRNGERDRSYLLLHQTSGSSPVEAKWLLSRMNLLCSPKALLCLLFKPVGQVWFTWFNITKQVLASSLN